MAAKVPQSEKVKWGRMIENYLHKSQMLKCVFLLVDIRHEPSANDKTMYDWVVYNGFRPVIIATKLDKIKRSQIQKQVKLIRTGLGMEKQDILIPFSAETKQGREDIWNLIDKMAAGEDLLTAEEEIQAEKAAEWAAKKAAKEAQQNLADGGVGTGSRKDTGAGRNAWGRGMEICGGPAGDSCCGSGRTGRTVHGRVSYRYAETGN